MSVSSVSEQLCVTGRMHARKVTLKGVLGVCQLSQPLRVVLIIALLIGSGLTCTDNHSVCCKPRIFSRALQSPGCFPCIALQHNTTTNRAHEGALLAAMGITPRHARVSMPPKRKRQKKKAFHPDARRHSRLKQNVHCNRSRL